MRFLLLGPVDFRPDSGPVRLGARRERLVLGALALHAGQAVTLARLASVLWPGDETPDTARRSIKVSVSRLRTVLAPYDIEISKRGDAYVLMVDPADTDAGRFRVAMAAAADLADLDARVAALREALALWRGDVLADVAGPDARRAIASDLMELRLVALRRAMEAEIERGRVEAAVAELRGLVAAEPAHEPFVCLLMSALVDSGRPAEALDVYADLRRVLADDLGVDPGPEAAGLYVQILRQQPAPAEATPRSAVQTLPRDVPMFSGRSDELAALDDGVAGTAPLVVITGAGGVGKTALAVHWAHRATTRFPDGQLFVNLRGYGAGQRPTAGDALTQLLLALGEPLTAIPPSTDGAATLLRARLAGRRMLLVVDNAASADEVRPLLPGSPGCGVVVTSRDPLSGLTAVEGAGRVSLRQMGEDQALVVLSSVLGADRVRREVDAATRLAGACGGLPLALRVAAANLTGHPERSIASYCDEMLRGSVLDALQVDGDLTMGVRATLASSYESLSAPARRLFRMVAVPAGADFTVAAAAALIGESVATATLLIGELCSAHLVDGQTDHRYGLHDLVRAYAVEVGAGPETESGRARLLACYLHSADNAAGTAYPNRRYLTPDDVMLPGLPIAEFTDRTDAFAWLDTEVANLVAESKQAAVRSPLDFAWKMCDALAGYFWVKRNAALWAGSIEAAEAATRAAGDDRMAMHVLNRRGIMHWGFGEYDRAETAFLDVVDHAHRLGDPSREAGALSNLGGIARDLDRTRDAKAYIERAIAIRAAHGDTIDTGARITLAFLASDLGEFEESLAYARQAVTAYRRIGHTEGVAAGQILVATALCDLGAPLEEGYAALAEARQAYEAVGVSAGLTSVWSAYAAMALADGRGTEALDCAKRSVAYAEECGQMGQIVSARLYLAQAYQRCGEVEVARHEFVETERLGHEVGIHSASADALIGLGELALDDGDTVAAAGYASRALSLTERFLTVRAANRLLAGIARIGTADTDQIGA